MGQVLSDNVWVGRTLLTKGLLRDSIDPELVGLVGSHLWVDEAARPNIDPSSGQALTGLVDNVWVDGKMYAKGSTDIPADVIPKIGDHMWVDGPPSAAAVESQKASSEGDPEGDDPSTQGHADSQGSVTSSRDIPPKGGPGSGKSAWADYARLHNVSLEPGSSREDIIDQLDDAGVPTE